MRILFDSTTPARSIPAGAQMVLAYIDGRITAGNYAAAKASHPNALLVSCTVVGTPGAKVGDCESGDMSVLGVVVWAATEVHAGRHPTIYCNSSTWPRVEGAVAHAGLTPIRDLSYGIAQYDNIPDIPADWIARGCVFKQYRSDTAQNLDYSVVADYWPGVDPQEEDMAALLFDPSEEGDAYREWFVCSHWVQYTGAEPDPQSLGLWKLAIAGGAAGLRQFRTGLLDSPAAVAHRVNAGG